MLIMVKANVNISKSQKTYSKINKFFNTEIKAK